MAHLTLFSSVPFFASLGDLELQALAAACRTRTFKRGEALFHEGDPGSALYIVRSGQVKIVVMADTGDETILIVLGPGECLGELSLVDGAPRSAAAVALDRVEALVLYREEFLAVLKQSPSAALAVMSGLAGMVRRLTAQVQDAAALDVPGRLAKKLLELAERHGQATPEGVRITLRLTQQELAQMVGATRVSINQHLGGFQDRGLLTMDREGITLLQPEQLRKRIY